MKSIIVAVLLFVGLCLCAPLLDSGAHPYVGVAYRYVPALSGYVTCSGTLVSILALNGTGVYAFVTTGQCIAYGGGNGEQFKVTFSQSPGFTRDPVTRVVTAVDTDVFHLGVGYTEYRPHHDASDEFVNFGFITLNIDDDIAQVVGAGRPSFPTTVGEFPQEFHFPTGDFTPLVTVGYGFLDSDAHVLGERRTCDITIATAIRQSISADVEKGCALGQSGIPLIANGVVYGFGTIPTVAPPPSVRPGAKTLYLRTDTSAFAALLGRVVPLISP